MCLASSHGAVIQNSSCSAVVRMTGIALGWMAPTSALGAHVRKAKKSAVTCPSFTVRREVQWSNADPGEEGQGPILGEGEPPGLRLAAGGRARLGEAAERHQASVLDAQPAAPMRAGRGADVGDAWIATAGWQEVPRRWHAPACHCGLPNAVSASADDRRGVVGVDARLRDQVAQAVAHDASG
ncbi:MAG: hypothetical protein JWR10_923 [Rubritepida sp.]|nr:hypothetical protein [Rubritepida sp.]